MGPVASGFTGDHSSFLITCAAQALCIVLLHTFWTVIIFDACDNINKMHIFYVIASHLLVSCFTLLNQHQLYEISLLSYFGLTIAVGVFTCTIVGEPLNLSK